MIIKDKKEIVVRSVSFSYLSEVLHAFKNQTV